MNSILFLALFLAYCINKFYLNKLNKVVRLIINIVITLTLAYAFGFISGLIIGSIMIVVQFIYELVFPKENKGIKENLIIKRNNIIISLILNVVLIIGIIGIFKMIDYYHYQLIIVDDFFESLELSSYTVLTVITSFVFLHKPCNDIIQSLTATYKMNINNDEEKVKTLELSKDEDGELNIVVNKEVNDNNLGRIIGTIERLVLFLLIFNGMYTLAGLVLTAKSIARYNKISTDKIFAEVYLLGTLLSLLLVVATCFLL